MVLAKPVNEGGRIAALEKYAILDTAREQSLDDFTLLASFVCRNANRADFSCRCRPPMVQITSGY